MIPLLLLLIRLFRIIGNQQQEIMTKIQVLEFQAMDFGYGIIHVSTKGQKLICFNFQVSKRFFNFLAY